MGVFLEGTKSFLNYFQRTMDISSITGTQRNHFREQLNTLQGLRRYIKYQEPITRSLQLPHIHVTAFSQTDLFLV